MVAIRPIVVLSTLTLLLGLTWFRRKKRLNSDTGEKSSDSSSVASDEANCEDLATLRNLNSRPAQSASVVITSAHTQDITPSKLAKSAPIDIVPNGRSPPMPIGRKSVGAGAENPNKIDADLLNAKIRDSELKVLASIEEQEDLDLGSPIDLPGSFDRRPFNYHKTVNVAKEEPVVIKATMIAKVSPKDDFLEPPKYLNTEEMRATEMSVDKGMDISSECRQTPTTELQVNGKDMQDDTQNPPPPISSPPLSLCSNHSLDSGKGSSPPYSEGAPANCCEFLLPLTLVGPLIGRKGSFVQHLKNVTGATVIVKRHPDTTKYKICAVEGTEAEIDKALAEIRRMFPLSKYPKFTMEKIQYSLPNMLQSMDPTFISLHLIEGINNDVVVSSILSGGHIFVQQPLHPSYPSLNDLNQIMYQNYASNQSPHLDNPAENSVCVACVQDMWYRVVVLSHSQETKTTLVKYLDYGGFGNHQSSDLRQIRQDFMTLPFQAIECTLSNIKPTGSEWAPAAAEVLQTFTHGMVLQAQVAGYTVEGLPEIYLYANYGKDNIVFLNRELVARGLAEWVEDTM
ncbi:KH domain-containing protein akap-1 isoform X2 [Phlebotomus papatasi]|uniref:KH domain-containing protein akap-1 isoform X2 n=1 Tax=Phlebotomus papatasi TaxID=29031 RepID=UPI002483712C|nr:KH domain-containing protein akap-1 isoform X2 [Phlebotomus papatasi]XP_055710096.1 KH domain-containing protein akap-1 isoform X2 [Phlebotomus papatasi]XP_055710097.1 KH domain-containing protein akap-1 isoform X2 [Phlebotomus papatasi]